MWMSWELQSGWPSQQRSYPLLVGLFTLSNMVDEICQIYQGVWKRTLSMTMMGIIEILTKIIGTKTDARCCRQNMLALQNEDFGHCGHLIIFWLTAKNISQIGAVCWLYGSEIRRGKKDPWLSLYMADHHPDTEAIWRPRRPGYHPDISTPQGAEGHITTWTPLVSRKKFSRLLWLRCQIKH